MAALSAACRINAQFLKHRKQITGQFDGRTVVIEKGISGMGSE
jgi:hypothetical protein